MNAATRPPSDAVVALRSLGRRFREAFSAAGDAASVDELAQRSGADGRSAIDHVVGATRSITFLGRAIELTLVDDDPVLHPAVLDVAEREWPPSAGTLDERLSELAGEADALADRVAHVSAQDWGRQARVAGHDVTVSAAAVLWDAVDSAIDHLRSAERTLAEVR